MGRRILKPWTAGFTKPECGSIPIMPSVAGSLMLIVTTFTVFIAIISVFLLRVGIISFRTLLAVSGLGLLVGASFFSQLSPLWANILQNGISSFALMNVSPPRSQVPIPLEMREMKIIERIVAVNCTCSIKSKDDEHSETDSGYSSPGGIPSPPKTARTVEESIELYKAGKCEELQDVELLELISRGVIPPHSLEKVLGDHLRAVRIRRSVVSRTPGTWAQAPLEISRLPYKYYNYADVVGRCAENVIGYVPLPVGVAGPLKIDGIPTFLPMATTEGTLIASTSRGCKAINAGGGVNTELVGDCMTRAPIVSFANISEASEAKRFIESAEGLKALRESFNATTNFGDLQKVTVRMAGSSLYLRFCATTGEAMGMNMVGKGVQAALDSLRCKHGFSHMKIVSLSGNYCTDKKPAAINWIEGRGKSVVAETFIGAETVQKVLKCSVAEIVKLNINKNLIGSALAGTSSGGFNAHAANVVTAIFIATGQDPAQNTVSSNCITIMEELVDGSLHATVSMPSIEVGTVGGGTHLAPQAAMLELAGVRTSKVGLEGNSASLARIIAGGVLAGELSLCAALVTGELIQSHMTYNRKSS